MEKEEAESQKKIVAEHGTEKDSKDPATLAGTSLVD
jgi:hypothetical protein